LSLFGDSNSSITNDGHITGTEVGIQAEFSTNGTITNNGVISSSGTGADEAAMVLDGAAEYIRNTGKISGPVAFDIYNGGDATIYNSGSISGTLDLFDTSGVTVDNVGTWHALTLDFTSSAENFVQNEGNIFAGVVMGTNGAGIDYFNNLGTLSGSVVLLGSQNFFYNSGTVGQFVESEAGYSQISNDGIIYGNVDMYQGCVLNTLHGRIDGNVTAANSDTFNFTGSFGKVVIKDFVTYASSHSGFDIINFFDDNFASYADVQKQMVQVGHNVVITLDATDVIVLDNTLLNHLSYHDFTFG
jgi:hypothetical protein